MREFDWIREILEESHSRILAGEIEEFKESHGRNFTETSDEMDFVNFVGELSLRSRIHDRNIRLLHKIEEALEKIEKGVYGMCQLCGEPIDTKRLKVRPMATLCIPCKEEQERERKTLPDEHCTYATRSIIHDWA